MNSLHEFIRKFAETVSKDPLALDAVKISFVAPPKTSMETLDIKKQKQFEANFQWNRFSVLLSNIDKTKWFTYITVLEPWGIKQKGTEEVIASDHAGALLKGDPIDFTPKEIENMFSDLLKKPNLDPSLPETMVTYINGHEKDKGKKYSPTEFKETFEDTKTSEGSNFYILISKTNELKTPFGKTVGKVPGKTSHKEEKT